MVKEKFPIYQAEENLLDTINTANSSEVYTHKNYEGLKMEKRF